MLSMPLRQQISVSKLSSSPSSTTSSSRTNNACLRSKTSSSAPDKRARKRQRKLIVRANTGGEKWQAMNVSLPNLRDNLDRRTTRNIDGKVYTLELDELDKPLVRDSFKQKYETRVNKAGVIEANLAGSVATGSAEMMSILGMNVAVDFKKITGMRKEVEVINGRAAMIGITAALFAKIGTGQGVAEQLFSPAGIFSALFISMFAIASSIAPAAMNKVTMDECFPNENKVYENEKLPVTWTAAAEAVNGKVAMGVMLVALITGQ